MAGSLPEGEETSAFADLLRAAAVEAPRRAILNLGPFFAGMASCRNRGPDCQRVIRACIPPPPTTASEALDALSGH